MLTKETTLADLATTVPAASRVFHRHGLDYCCGGRRTLVEACVALGVDAANVVQEIERAGSGVDHVDWRERPIDELIDHVIQDYHEPLRFELPRLIEMAERVEHRHAARAEVPRGLTAHLMEMHAQVLEHLAKEEQILFPMIRRGEGAMAGGPIRVMRLEHDDHGANLRLTRELTRDFRVPEDACPTWAALYLGLDELEHELMEHVHLENNVLFPRACAAE